MTQNNNPDTSIEACEASNTEKLQTPKWLASNSLRFGVYVIDTIFLSIIVMILGQLLADFWSSIGQWSRLTGYLIAVLYFGIQNSHVRQGQTLAKKIFKISVMDKNHNYLSVGKSCLRAGIFALPFALNGVGLDVHHSFINQIIGVIQSVIIFGGFFVILYLLIANKDTKQNIHDLLVGSYVLNLKVISENQQNTETELQDFEASFNKPFPTAKPRYKKVVMIILVLSSIAPILFLGMVNRNLNAQKTDKPSIGIGATIDNLSTIRQSLKEKYPDIVDSNLSYNNTQNTNFNTNTTTKVMTIVAKVSVNDIKHLDKKYAEKIAQTIKQEILADDKNLSNIDNIEVVINYGYDLYLFNKWQSGNYVFKYEDVY